MQQAIRSDRVFKVWEYRVSHAQLLLRSPKSEAHPRNLDVIFVGVEYLDLPTRLEGIEILPGDADDVRDAQRGHGKPVGRECVFALSSTGRRHIVVATSVRELANDLDLFESSLETFQP